MMSVLKQNLRFIPLPPRYCMHSSDNLNLEFLLLTSNVVDVTAQMTVDSSETISQHGFFSNRLHCKGSTLATSISSCDY